MSRLPPPMGLHTVRMNRYNKFQLYIVSTSDIYPYFLDHVKITDRIHNMQPTIIFAHVFCHGALTGFKDNVCLVFLK